MRLGIVSDIHSNLPALESVLSFLDANAADSIVHAGDIVGYNPQPNEVIGLIRKRGIVTISGNHDITAMTGDTSRLNAMAAAVIFWTRRMLSAKSREYLQSLPVSTEFAGVRVHHGSPFDRDEYVYESMADETYLEEAGGDILVLGHTHIPFVKRFGEDRLIVNPGSVGQPRDGNPLASCAVLDTETMECAIHRLGYEIESVVEEIRQVGLPQCLGERLLLGR